MGSIKKTVLMLLFAIAGLAISIKLLIPRYRIFRHINETVTISHKEDMEKYEGRWAELTYDYCFSGMYLHGMWLEDNRGYGVFKLAGKKEYVYGSIDGAFEYLMEGKNFFFHTNKIKETEPYTLEGYILRIPTEEQEILIRQAHLADGDYKFLNADEETNYEYVLQIKNREKEKSIFRSLAALTFYMTLFLCYCILKLKKEISNAQHAKQIRDV